MENKTCGECQHCAAKTEIATCEKAGIVTGNVPACDKFAPKPMTNGDKIRAMSNEELSCYLSRQIQSAILLQTKIDVDYERKLQDWLNAPAESEV